MPAVPAYRCGHRLSEGAIVHRCPSTIRLCRLAHALLGAHAAGAGGATPQRRRLSRTPLAVLSDMVGPPLDLGGPPAAGPTGRPPHPQGATLARPTGPRDGRPPLTSLGPASA
jgi:hypothetical protein